MILNLFLFLNSFQSDSQEQIIETVDPKRNLFLDVVCFIISTSFTPSFKTLYEHMLISPFDLENRYQIFRMINDKFIDNIYSDHIASISETLTNDSLVEFYKELVVVLESKKNGFLTPSFSIEESSSTLYISEEMTSLLGKLFEVTEILVQFYSGVFSKNFISERENEVRKFLDHTGEEFSKTNDAAFFFVCDFYREIKAKPTNLEMTGSEYLFRVFWNLFNNNLKAMKAATNIFGLSYPEEEIEEEVETTGNLTLTYSVYDLQFFNSFRVENFYRNISIKKVENIEYILVHKIKTYEDLFSKEVKENAFEVISAFFDIVTVVMNQITKVHQHHHRLHPH